uniref:1-acylglycerol-3-phosphate O-acyltransferase n=1 Tax=Schistocephalus solidus TaxID=70667 RepID=A0A0X3NSC2_SCHSO
MWDLMAEAFGLRTVVHGSVDHLNAQPHVIVCNHQSFLDILSLIPVWPRVCTFVAKRSIRFYGPFGLLVWFLKAILIDRKDRMGSIGELQRAAEIIREEQVSVIIFPEGTRGSMGEKLLPFKKGPFHMAISAQVIIFHHLLVL